MGPLFYLDSMADEMMGSENLARSAEPAKMTWRRMEQEKVGALVPFAVMSDGEQPLEGLRRHSTG